jgi:hypothetical protein
MSHHEGRRPLLSKPTPRHTSQLDSEALMVRIAQVSRCFQKHKLISAFTSLPLDSLFCDTFIETLSILNTRRKAALIIPRKQCFQRF